MQIEKRLVDYANMISFHAATLLHEELNLNHIQQKQVSKIIDNVRRVSPLYYGLIDQLKIEKDIGLHNLVQWEALHELRNIAAISICCRHILEEYTNDLNWSAVQVDAWFHLQQYAMLLEDTINRYEYPRLSI